MGKDEGMNLFKIENIPVISRQTRQAALPQPLSKEEDQHRKSYYASARKKKKASGVLCSGFLRAVEVTERASGEFTLRQGLTPSGWEKIFFQEK